MTDFSKDLAEMLSAANEGQLTLSKDASERCALACEKYLAGLGEMFEFARKARNLSGFGTLLASGVALQEKYASIAVGDDHSLDTVLRQHIEVATRLKEVFEAAGRGYADTEAANASTITGTY